MKIDVSKQNITTEKMTKWMKIKKAWKEIGLSSTSHGIPKHFKIRENIFQTILDSLSAYIFKLLFLFNC